MRLDQTISPYLIVAAVILSLFASSGAHGQSRAAWYQAASLDRANDGRLVLFNTHTGERLIVFRHGEEYISSALDKLDYFLRDHRTGDVRHFDPRLFDILSDVTVSLGHPGGEIDIVCG
jgi:uncharacterized protein YcbK (DUF882 family)